MIFVIIRSGNVLSHKLFLTGRWPESCMDNKMFLVISAVF